jgi:hypothetical protein
MREFDSRVVLLDYTGLGGAGCGSMGHGSHGSWVILLIGHMGHGSSNVTHCLLWTLEQTAFNYIDVVLRIRKKTNGQIGIVKL